MKLRLALIALLLALAGIRTWNDSSNPESDSDIANVQASIILAGDSGDLNREALYSLKTLARQSEMLPGKTSVYFLGDNIYEKGLPEREHPEFKRASQILEKQLLLLKNPKAKIFFLPGNHDWAGGGSDGFRNVVNQGKAIARQLGSDSFVPGSGCPGPVISEDLPWIRVVAFDSQWWLHKHDKPRDSSYGCPAWTEQMVKERLEDLLGSTEAQKPVMFLQHHPLESIGSHGGASKCTQDMGCPLYQSMRSELLSVLDKANPLICAAGHDHNLQHLDGGYGCRNFLVSGSISRPRSVVTDQRTRYAYGSFGFFRLDRLKNGSIRLRGIETAQSEPNGKVGYETIIYSPALPDSH